MPNRPPRLKVFQRYDLPLFFVTSSTHKRKSLLANQTVHDIFIAYCEKGSLRGAGVGRYVLMPDHIHLLQDGCGGTQECIRDLMAGYVAVVFEKS